MAHFEQERHVELVAGANQLFVITNRMIDAVIPAELPHVNVFVVNVVAQDDPKQDTLARVATIADLTTIPIGRDPGIAAPGPDGTQFLSASWTQSYDTLETALNAAQVFRDRVNQLIVDWGSFTTSFDAPDPTPAIYTFPATDTSQKTALIQAYKVAKQDRYQKQIDKTAADAALSAAQADLTYKQSLVSDLLSTAALATQLSSEVSSLSGYLSNLLASGTTFAGNNPGGVGLAAFQTALNTATSQSAQATAYVSDAASLSALIAAYQAARSTDVTTASAAVAAATTDQATKAAALTAAQSTETTALAAVIAICPDFDKHSVPFVDDNEP